MGSGSIVLGILNEAVENISRHRERASFWRAVCENSRWILPFRRMCILIEKDREHEIVARYAQGQFEGASEQREKNLTLWSDRNQRVQWVIGPDILPGHCPTCDWIAGMDLPEEPSTSILSVPIPGDEKAVGRMLFSVVDPEDKATLSSLAKVYALHVGMTYRMIESVERLKHSEQRFSSLFQKSGEGIVVHDLDGRVLESNQKLRDLMGYDETEILKINIADFHPPEIKILTSENLKSVEQKKYLNLEFEMVRKSGERFLAEVTATLIEMEGQPIIQSIVRDVTERRRMTTELEQARDRAQSANVAKSEFLSRMSHEIRTPMNAIMGMTELLSETELNPEQQNFVSVLGKSGESLLVLINDVLDLSRIEAGRVELEEIAFEPGEVLSGIWKMMGVEAKRKNLGFDFILGADTSHFVRGDSYRLRQVLVNLAANAIKFTDSGRVTLELHRTEADDGGENRIALVFLVTDTGIGIPEDRKAGIFDSFSQVDSSITRRFGGSGLGLAIAGHLVKMMGGRLDLRENPGGGSVFYFTLNLPPAEPRKPQSTKSKGDASSALQAALPDSLRILLVDDSEDNRMLVQSFLKKYPFHIDIAEDGAVAVRRFQKAEYDLVLMDMQMPVLDGLSATREIRRYERELGRPATPIIALTAYALRIEKERSLEAGCTAHLSKPIKKTTLLEAIQRYAGN